MAGSRRKGRIAALQILYEVDSSRHDWPTTVDRTLEESNLPEEAQRLARELVEGVSSNLETLDASIQEHAPAWPVGQLSAVDRNILRIAIFEILLNNKTPPKAAINEAVELAKIFGSENLHRFVNGVLGSVVAATAYKE
jgi:N utilization substance protein B